MDCLMLLLSILHFQVCVAIVYLYFDLDTRYNELKKKYSSMSRFASIMQNSYWKMKKELGKWFRYSHPIKGGFISKKEYDKLRKKSKKKG